jgi:hypothetical protein
MDQGKIWENLPVAILLGTLFMLQAAPDYLKPYLLWGGTLGTILSMVGIDYGFRVKASEYLHILLILRPSGIRMNLFIKKPAEGVRSRLYDQQTDMYETAVELGEKASHPFYKNVNMVIFKHQMPWEQRMIFMPGKAWFRGYAVDHNSTATIVAYEPSGETARAQVEFLNPALVCTIAEAPNDWYILTAQPTELETVNVQTNGGEGTAMQTVQQTKDCKGCTTLVKAQADAVDLKRRLYGEHQARIRLEGEVEELRNEFQGAISRVRDVAKLVLEELMTLLSGHTDIVGAIREVQPHALFKITRNIVLLILGALGIYLFATNEELRAWISGNQLLIIIIVLGGAVLTYYLMQRRK